MATMRAALHDEYGPRTPSTTGCFRCPSPVPAKSWCACLQQRSTVAIY